MNCPKCAFSNAASAKFCGSCGAPLSLPNNISIEPRVITVGRTPQNSIVINEKFISRNHAKITFSSGVFTLEDLGSVSGTFVNGSKITISRITQSDKIQFGSYEVTWHQIETALNSSQHEVPGRGLSEGTIKFAGDANKQLMILGRSPECDIVVDNIKVSRQHARLTKIGNDWNLEDLGSANGTFLNGKKVTNAKISEQDVVTLGGIPISIKKLFKSPSSVLHDFQLSAQNLVWKVEDKTIVDNISITVYPGEFVGLIGSAGCGKSSLMMLMNGMVRPTYGSVYVNSLPLHSNFDSFKGLFGYVPQDDIIHRELRVRECFYYNAKLRFPSVTTDTEINGQVDSIIKSLELTDVTETLIGSPEKKGISGGQRKRVNLGQELLTEPLILFLDEPTTGLDPRRDKEVMKTLQKISQTGKIVLIVTHQITEHNFNLFTHLVVLARGGKLAYFGPADEAKDYFHVSNPAEIFDKLEAEEPSIWKEKYLKSEYQQDYIEKRKRTDWNKNSQSFNSPKIERKINFSQFITLTQRYLKIKLRDTVSTLILLLQAPIIAVLIALVFTNEGAKTQAAFVMVVAAIWLGCSNAAREIVNEQAIYKRERMVSLKIPSYIFSKIFILSVLCVLQSVILAGIVVPSLSMNVSFMTAASLLSATAISSLCIGLFLSAIVKTSEAAMSLTPLVLIPQVILGGLMVTLKDMNEFIQVIAGFMISRWSFEALLNQEVTNSTIIEQKFGFNYSNTGLDIFMICLFCVVFIVLTGVVLKKKDMK